MTSSDRRTFLRDAAAGAAAIALLPELGAIRPPRRAAPLAVGVVGAGRQGRAILAELQKLDGVRIAAVCDSLEGRLRAGQRRAGREAKGYADHRAMLAEQADLDAVCVATPTDSHRAVVIDALAAGKHVYCEAPLAHTVEDAKAIVLAARGRAARCQVGLLARSNPIYKLAWTFHQAGVLEKLAFARAQDHEKTSWRFPAADPEVAEALNWRLDPARCGGLPAELGTHQFDVVDWFLGDYPVAVSGRGAIRLYGDGRAMADTARCTLRYADGLELQWSGSLCTGYEGRYEQLSGSMGSIRLAWNAGWLFKEADSPTQGWEVYANRQSFHDDEGITLIADATKLAKQGKLQEGVGLPHPPLYYALVDFVAAVADGGEVACSVEEGLRATAIGLAAQRAVTGGGDVEIDPADLKAE